MSESEGGGLAESWLAESLKHWKKWLVAGKNCRIREKKRNS